MLLGGLGMVAGGLSGGTLLAAAKRPSGRRLFAPDNLMAWCIVPFDAKKRGPEERAEMLKTLGLRRFAYDWRDEHLPTLDQPDRVAPQEHTVRGLSEEFRYRFPPHSLTILRLRSGGG